MLGLCNSNACDAINKRLFQSCTVQPFSHLTKALSDSMIFEIPSSPSMAENSTSRLTSCQSLRNLSSLIHSSPDKATREILSCPLVALSCQEYRHFSHCLSAASMHSKSFSQLERLPVCLCPCSEKTKTHKLEDHVTTRDVGDNRKRSSAISTNCLVLADFRARARSYRTGPALNFMQGTCCSLSQARVWCSRVALRVVNHAGNTTCVCYGQPLSGSQRL